EDRGYAMVHAKVVPVAAADVEAILEQIERITQETLPGRLAAATVEGEAASQVKRHRAEIVAAHVGALALQFGTRVGSPDDLRDALEMGPPEPSARAIEDAVAAFMASDAFDDPIPKTPEHPEGDATHRIARAIAALGAPPADDAAKKTWRTKFAP